MIKNKLKIKIAEKETTNREIAKKIGVNENTISRWINGNSLEQIYNFYLLCKELDVDIKDIFE